MEETKPVCFIPKGVLIVLNLRFLVLFGLFSTLGLNAQAQLVYVRGDLIGNWTSEDVVDPDNVAQTFNFDGNAVGAGIRVGVMYGGAAIPFVKTGTEFRLSYAPIKETDGDSKFESGVFGGIFQRVQFQLPTVPLKPYFAVGTAGAAKTFTTNSDTFKSSNFSLKPAAALGVDVLVPNSKMVVGVDASYTQDGPKLIAGSVGFNF